MQSSHPPPHVVLLAPPGSAVHDLCILPTGQVNYSPPSAASRPPPQLFRAALVIRAAVFMLEQHCSGAEEVDGDDGVSWHWVLYAEGREDYESEDEGPATARVQERPAATIRLVPAQAHPDADDDKAVEGPDYKGSQIWDHKEPYVKIGRLATLSAFRGRGYAKILVNSALEYAGSHAQEMVKEKEMGEWKGLVLAHAQKRVEGWYKGLGFEFDEGMGSWLEEGIEHVGMWKRVELAQ